MIPARVVVVVLLRELVTLGACYDAARGLPIIHLNYLGYDEQAHRRGPDSQFAHWTLNRIDESIRQIWKSAQRSNGRNYDLWVFSDHGQERTTPYQLKHGKLVQQVVADVVQDIVDTSDKEPDGGGAGSELSQSAAASEPPSTESPAPSKQKKQRLPTRADWLGLGWLVRVLFGEQDYDMQTRSGLVQTVTSGSIGFVYFQDHEAKRHQQVIAERLVRKEHVPMCAFADAEGVPWVFTDAGQFRLPDEADRAFGNHPFQFEVADDMIRLIQHADAGDMVLIGWNGRGPSASFVIQNGAHAGPGIDETHGFALLPADTLLPGTGRDFLRPNDLRLAALRFLGRIDSTTMARKRPQRKSAVRVLTYNVHACVGMDGQLSPGRIARVIDQSEADIVCLQELDVGRRRSGHLDQAELIARHLEMSHQFHPAWHLEDEQFGNAIMTRLPMRIVQRQSLHHHKADRSRRSALWAEVVLADGTALQIVNTHLSIYPKEQKIQTQQLVDEWLKPASLLGPVILCGDFNARPRSPAHRILSNALRDIESYDANPARRTLFSPFPLSRVDHGFVSPNLSVSRVLVFDSQLARVASDHRPLAFDVSLEAIEAHGLVHAIDRASVS
jgi:endonuclease/exonuclease/phosphatase family metal-dependent hydrolase